MIIELSEKYNINSKYTSFITVYERKNKLLDVPKYQETTLSNKFAKEALRDKVWNIFGMDECEEDYEEYECDMAAPAYLRARSSANDLDIPSFLRKKKCINSESKVNKPVERQKTNKEILQEKVDEYYEKFILQDKRSILTYLLYAVYYLENSNNKFNYNALLRFLNNNKEILLSNDLYMKLIYLCYTKLTDNRFIDKKETLELLNEDYRKIAYTNLKINIDLKTITDNEVKDIISKDKVIENIDDVIWYLYNSSYIGPWIR